jgi:AraC-like DNA-binding protein
MDGVTVTLRMGTAFNVLGVPARDLAETAVPLDLLWRGEARRLQERMLEAPDDRARIAMLARTLRARVAPPQSLEHACIAHAALLLERAEGRLSVRELATSVGVGERRLQQLFSKHVGVSPRAWGRLARMHALLRALRRPAVVQSTESTIRPSRSWAQLAAEVGYYDQAHLANEFRSLCGVSPGAFLRLRAAGPT